MLYFIIAIFLIYLLIHIILLPGLFHGTKEVEIRQSIKKPLYTIVGLSLVLLIARYFIDFGYYESGHVWSIMTLIGVMLYSFISYANLSILDTDLKKEYEDLRKLKHGDKDELKKAKDQLEKDRVELENLKAQIDGEQTELNLLKFDLEQKKKELDELEHKLHLREVELEDEMKEINLMKKASKKEIKEEIQRATKNHKNKLEKEYHQKLMDAKNLTQENYNQKLQEYVERLTKKMEDRIKNEKSSMVDNLFHFEGTDDDDFFELKKSKEELEKSKLMFDLDQKVLSAKEHVLDAKKSALEVKSENVEIKADMKILASDFKMDLLKEQTERLRSQDEVLKKLEMEQQKSAMESIDIRRHIELIQEKNKTKFMELQHYFENQMKDLQIETKEVFRQVKENMSDMKLKFGQEILLLDGQHQNILTELEQYYLKNREYVHQCQTLALEAKTQNIEGSKLLDQINVLHQEHKLNSREVQIGLNNSLQQLDFRENSFANSVADAMLTIKVAGENNRLALRDIALERRGIDIAYSTKEQEHRMNLQEIRHQRQDLDRTQKEYKLEQALKEDEWESSMYYDRMNLKRQQDQFDYAVSIERASRDQRYLNTVRGMN